MQTRPVLNKQTAIAEIARQLAPKISKWSHNEISTQAAENDLRHALQFHQDGFQIATSLKDYFGYEPNADLVEILEQAQTIKTAIKDKLDAAWVANNNIQPPEIGANVTFKDHHGNEIHGEILANFETGKSVVHCPSQGHVKTGPGTRGHVIDWEKLDVQTLLTK